ncbi:sigma-70 family RNA polymerase sigma factor [Chitinophaga niabensis]|uniref:RNA polymerase sigma factor n=1 Tax=Chitinophaga niabensis TaxID=536979 RepID=UPI0031BB91C5
MYDTKELLHRIAEGDQQAFTRMVEEYRKNIYTTALRLLHSTVLAEETLQDIFLKVWLQRKDLVTIDNFPAWLNAVARNTIYNSFQRSLKEKGTDTTEGLEGSIISALQPEQQLQEKEYTTLLQKAIDRLPARQKQTYQLIRQEGLKREEAAKAMNVSPETVKHNLEEATRKVRAYCLAQLPLSVLLLLVNIK